MLFSLSNVKRRSVRDPDGELAVVPKLLHGRAALKLLEQAIATFEQFVGRPRSEYDQRALEAVLSDYRLARCVESCLQLDYAFVPPRIEDALPPEQMDALRAAGISSPSDLRMALWDAANARFGGYVPPAERETFLCSLARSWGLSGGAALLDTLLSLDSASSAVLSLKGERPAPWDLMLRHNRGVVKTLLAHSTQVHVQAGSLPGSALKRLYFMAKRSGTLVDVEQAGAQGSYALTLYGPEQAFGSPEKYGLRLADITLSLLRRLLEHGSEAGEQVQVRATAQLVLHDRPYRFHVGRDTLEHLDFLPHAAEKAVAGSKPGRVAENAAQYTVGSALEPQSEQRDPLPEFDSLVEEAFYREHHSLEKGGYTHGWRLLREPDPLVAPGLVLIPDFAFERGGTRVYMEIAGFWSPGYRERKLQKLRLLAGQKGSEVALLLAVPQDAVSLFKELPFPAVPYKTKLRATDILTALDEQFGGREEREEVARGRISELRAAALARGYVPEREVAGVMNAYTRTELLGITKELDGEGCLYIAGVGLLSEIAFHALMSVLRESLSEGADGRISLDAASSLTASVVGEPVDIEALVQAAPDIRVERPSLFEAYVVGVPGEAG